MPLARPSLSTLRERVSADITGRLQRGPLLQRSVLYLLAQAMAGAVHGVYGLLSYIWDQTFPDTADTENLDKQAQLYGVPRRDPSFAAGEVLATGAIGSAIAEGTELVRADGASFELSDAQRLAIE
ncbi:MAG: baseplate J/gp47 family protein, partial [Planctomycetota bacterium]